MISQDEPIEQTGASQLSLYSAFYELFRQKSFTSIFSKLLKSRAVEPKGIWFGFDSASCFYGSGPNVLDPVSVHCYNSPKTTEEPFYKISSALVLM